MDAATIEEHLFKVEDADVFLSHAHRDHDQVVRLAVALEQLKEIVGKTEDAALKPLVRFQMPPSSHTLEWAELHRVIREQLDLKRIQGKDTLRSLDAIYKPLKLSKAEQRLLAGDLSDAVPVR